MGGTAAAGGGRQTFAAPLKVGDRVKILRSANMRRRIVELRSPLGPKGAQIYRVRVRQKPIPASIEIREDELEALPATP